MTETTPDTDDDGPACETCGNTTCPDADLPGFSEPRSCAYAPVYEALRYDRCEYGCGRDITNETIRRDVVPAVGRIVAAEVRAALTSAVSDSPVGVDARVESCRMVSPRVCGPCGRDAGHDGPHRSTGDTFTAYWDQA